VLFLSPIQRDRNKKKEECKPGYNTVAGENTNGKFKMVWQQSDPEGRILQHSTLEDGNKRREQLLSR
jgi:hypothetical protein